MTVSVHERDGVSDAAPGHVRPGMSRERGRSFVLPADAVYSAAWRGPWAMYAVIMVIVVLTGLPHGRPSGGLAVAIVAMCAHVVGKLLVARLAVRSLRAVPAFRLRVRGYGVGWLLVSTVGGVTLLCALCLLVQAWAFEPTPAAAVILLARELLSTSIVFAVAAVLTSVVRMLRGLRRQADFDRYLDREIRRAECARARADLRVADATLNPTLLALAIRGAIADLPHDVPRAERTLFAAADVLRDAIAAGELTEVSLMDERVAIDRFFTTVTSRAIVHWDIAPSCADMLVSRPLLWAVVVTALGVPHDVCRRVVVQSTRRMWIIDVFVDDDSTIATVPMDHAAVAAIADKLAVQHGVGLAGIWPLGGPAVGLRVMVPVLPGPRVATRAPRLRWSHGVRRFGCRALPRVAVTAAVLWLAVMVDGVLFMRRGVVPAESVSHWPSSLWLAGWRALGVVAAVVLAVAAVRRMPLGLSASGGLAMRTHLSAFVATILFTLAAAAVQGPLPDLAAVSLPDALASRGVWRALSIGIVFVLVSIAAHADVYAARRTAAVAQWRALRARRAGVRAATRDAELRALSAELAPHFVGNALHAAIGVLRESPADAVPLLQSLLTLADRVSSATGSHVVTLQEEIVNLEPFLEIERARLGSRPGALSFAVEVDDSVRHVCVPRFCLQPLVENAVRHGIMPRGTQGHIVVRAFADGETRLVLEVADDGVGPVPARGSRPSGAGLGCGTGTRVVRSRLAALYGPRATYSLHPGPVGGSVARLELPRVPA